MASSSKYILIVDDDGDMRSLVADVLGAEGFSVASVPNGLAALEYVGEAGVPALVLMDLTMPVMDGKQFLAERRKWACLTHVPFVVITANTMVNAADLGAAEVLFKPVDLDRLVALARRYNSLASGVYQAVEQSSPKTG